MQMKQVVVLRNVPVTANREGTAVRQLVAGTVDEVPADLYDGLRKEGYVTDDLSKAPRAKQRSAADIEAEKLAARAAVVVPEAWAELAWDDLRPLAAQLTDAAVRSKEDAANAITAELERRKAVAAA